METFNEKEYWNNRYVNGGSSGAGSYGVEAMTKANIINHWIKQHNIKSITETGMGDGNNLLLYHVPISYTGYDISEKAVEICNEKTRKIPNSLKYFFTNEYDKQDFDADLMLCLDLWYHQVNDASFEALCKNLFVDFRGKFIIIYSTDTNSQFLSDGTPLAQHLKFREVLSKVQEFPKWELLYWVSGFNGSDGKQYLFPSEKRFFLYSNVEKNGKALG